MKGSLPLGKLSPEDLARLLGKHTFSLPDDRVLVRPGVGEDAAVIDMGDRWLVAKTDPITFASDEIGWYAVHVNANDIAAAGGVPRWFLSSLLLPEGRTDMAAVERIMGQIAAACRSLGVVPCGGHTEVTYDLDRPIVVGVMLGEIVPGRLIRSSGVRVGDVILLTKGVAVEATAIIAREKEGVLARSFSRPYLERCRAFLRDPGISVVPEARAALAAADVHAMHDPTEGGLATGLWELAAASGVGFEVDAEAIPIYDQTRQLCAAFGLDPLGVIASGSLLIAVCEADVRPVSDALHRAGIAVAPIARAWPAERGLVLRSPEGTRPLPRYDQDEIARLF
ncbi:MAG: AIR synthase family protein [Anaerolineae bacterium]|nr:AIR synthase family protein [Anaerolineae bacterium]